MFSSVADHAQVNVNVFRYGAGYAKRGELTTEGPFIRGHSRKVGERDICDLKKTLYLKTTQKLPIKEVQPQPTMK